MATPAIRIIPCTDRALVLGYKDHLLDPEDFKGLPEPYPEFEQDVIGVGGDWTSYQHVILRRGTSLGGVEVYDSSTNGTEVPEQNVTLPRSWTALSKSAALLLSSEVLVRVALVERNWVIGFVPVDASGKTLLDDAMDVACRVVRTLSEKCKVTGIAAAVRVEPRHRLIGRIPLTNTWIYLVSDEPRKAASDEARPYPSKKRPSDKREPKARIGERQGSKQSLREALFSEAITVLGSIPQHEPSARVLGELCDYAVPNKRFGVIGDTIMEAKDMARKLHSMSMCRGQIEEEERRLDCSGCPGWFVDRFPPNDSAVLWFDARKANRGCDCPDPGEPKAWYSRLDFEIGREKGAELAIVLRDNWSDKIAEAASSEFASQGGPAHKQVLKILAEIGRRDIRVPKRVLSRILCSDPKAQSRIDMWLRRATKKKVATP